MIYYSVEIKGVPSAHLLWIKDYLSSYSNSTQSEVIPDALEPTYCSVVLTSDSPSVLHSLTADILGQVRNAEYLEACLDSSIGKTYDAKYFIRQCLIKPRSIFASLYCLIHKFLTRLHP